MSQNPQDIQAILAALAQRPPAANQAPPQTQMAHTYPPPAGQPPLSYPPPATGPPSVPYGMPSYGLPQPSSSGSLDLSSIRPVNTGTVSISDAIAQAKAFAAQKGVSSYDRPVIYAGNDLRGERDPRSYSRRSRSRSPPRRDAYRDNFNPYRDERREERADRGYGHERPYSPEQRGRGPGQYGSRGSGGRDRSPMRGDDNTETIQIEGNLVGLIIGRQGENLRRIESETGCRVQFISGGEGGMRQCKITGPYARRADVKAAIDRIIEDSGLATTTNRVPQDTNRDYRNTGGASALREGEESMKIMVPDRTVGLIIGRGGETIRDLQERSGCHINIVGESKSVNGLRPVNLIGTREQAQLAKDLILEIVDSDSRDAAPSNTKKGHKQDHHRVEPGPGGHDKINDTIHVPSDAVGMIIGKGGETIKEIQNMTGCKINVAQSGGPGELEREIALIGSHDSITRAKRAIEEKVDAVRQKQSSRGRGHDNDRHPAYSQPSSNGPSQTNIPAQQPATGDAPDPYAPYGGYTNYLNLWYQQYLNQQGGAGAAQQPPQPGSK